MMKGKDQIVSGVCSGLSEAIGFKDPIWVRLFFILGGFFWIYVILMFLMDDYENKSVGKDS